MEYKMAVMQPFYNAMFSIPNLITFSISSSQTVVCFSFHCELAWWCRPLPHYWGMRKEEPKLLA